MVQLVTSDHLNNGIFQLFTPGKTVSPLKSHLPISQALPEKATKYVLTCFRLSFACVTDTLPQGYPGAGDGFPQVSRLENCKQYLLLQNQCFTI